MSKVNPDNIEAYECKHVFYAPSTESKNDDLVFIKERLHLKDGTTVPNTRMLSNPKRTFYVTKKGKRNHEQKKLFEKLSNVNAYTTTQSRLSTDVAKALGNPGYNPGLRQLAKSPYLYGTDVSMEALTKYKYMTKYPKAITPNTVAVLDIETDIRQNNEVILSCALTFKSHAVLAVYAPWVEEIDDVEGKVKAAAKKYLSDIPDDGTGEKNDYCGDVWGRRNIDLEVVLCKTSGECAKVCIDRAHTWMPDFIAIWNIDFDLPKIMTRCELDGINLADMFSDPKVPPAYRFANYIRGNKTRETASGKKMNLAPAEQWHRFTSPASFFMIDAMCVYRIIRAAKGLDPSYALDAILTKELGVRKLKFSQADHCTAGYEWHAFMQANYKIEYLVYNLFDCISVEMLDEKEKDLSTTINNNSKQSEYTIFPRQPKRTSYSLHFYALDKGMVIASTPPEIAVEDDKEVVSTDGHIITLSTHLVDDNGLKCLKDYPDLTTYLRAFVFDLDVSSAYPNSEICFNISKETTLRELCAVQGVSEGIKRRAAMNLTMPRQNASEICQDILGSPSLPKLLKQYEADKAKKDITV